MIKLQLNKIFLLPILIFSICISSCTKKVVKVEKIQDLDGLILGCKESTISEDFLRKNVKYLVLNTYKVEHQSITDLINGSVDAVLTDGLLAHRLVEKNPGLKIVDLGIASEEYCVAVKKGNKELLSKINSTIKKIKENGIYTRMFSTFINHKGDDCDECHIELNELKTAAQLNFDKTLKMGTFAASPPFIFIENGKEVGFDIVLGQLIAYYSENNIEIIDMLFQRLFEELNAGNIDFACAAITATKERSEIVDFSLPYFSTNQVVIIRDEPKKNQK